jgi:hypothetical protein
VPISPVTYVAPVLVIAPTAVNNAKPEAAPKSGACPKFTFGKDNRVTAVIARVKIDFFVLYDFIVSEFLLSDLKGR